MAFLIIDCYIGLFGTGFMQVLYLGRAPRTKETLLDFREECQVTQHSRVFRRLTGSQRTPGFWGVTVLSNLNHSIRIRNDQVMAKTKTWVWKNFDSISFETP